jgi:hypothetical protein
MRASLSACNYSGMADQSAQIATICECIDHCFGFAMWYDDFALSTLIPTI